MLLQDAQLQEAATIIATPIACVMLSVVLHGMSALPEARRLGRSAE